MQRKVWGGVQVRKDKAPLPDALSCQRKAANRQKEKWGLCPSLVELGKQMQSPLPKCLRDLGAEGT